MIIHLWRFDTSAQLRPPLASGNRQCRHGARGRWVVVAATVLAGACSPPAARHGAAPAGGASPGPPPAPVRPVVDTLHGIPAVDPYRWMEDERDPQVQAWYRAQSEHAERVLASIPGRDTLRAQIEAALGEDTGLWGVWPTATRLFTRRFEPGADAPVLLVRDHPDAVERVLMAPDTLTLDGKRFSFRGLSPSPDGRHVALSLTGPGDTEPTLLVVDAATGARRERISDVLWGSGQGFSASWLPDGSGFLYTKGGAAGDAPQTERHWRGRVYLHRLGTDPGGDPAVFGFGVSDAVPLQPQFTPFVVTGEQSGHVAVRLWHGGHVSEVWTAPIAALDGARTPWHRAVAPAEGLGGVLLHGDALHLRTAQGAPRYRAVRRWLAGPDSGRVEDVLPEGEGVLMEIAAARDALYAVRRDGGGTRVFRVPHAGGGAEEVPLPFAAFATLATSSSRDGAYVRLVSWLQPERAYRYDPGTRRLALAGLEPEPTFDSSPYVIVSTHAPARDGTMIPLTLVHRRDLRRDGERLVHLRGYGSFGTSVDPYFAPELSAWLDRGGIFAVAHVRGGGELGGAWHAAGSGANKPVAIADLIAGAEHLVRVGYTRPGRIAIEGSSAGSFLIGNAVIDRPDLFGAALFRVGVGDAIRFYHTPGGARNIGEFGSLEHPAGIRSLLNVSAMHRVRDGVAYPAVLFENGATDYVLPLWQTGKLVARMQAAQAGPAPLLWRIDWGGGHGGSDSNDSYAARMALRYAFLLWRLGHPDFQPESR